MTLFNGLIKWSSHESKIPLNGIQPPELVQTRWGSWLNVVKYYYTMDKIISFVLNSERNKLIQNLAEKYGKLFCFEMIDTTYGFLSDLIKQCEHSEFSIRNAGDMINTISFIDEPVEIQKYLKTRIADTIYLNCTRIMNQPMKI